MLLKIIRNMTIQSNLNKTTGKNCPEGKGLQALQSFLRIVFSSSAPHLRKQVDRCYKVYIENEPVKLTNQDGGTNTERPQFNAKKINLWCFSAAFGFDKFLFTSMIFIIYIEILNFRMQYLFSKNIRSLILTSGTLAPLKPLITEMELGNAIQLKNPHIIHPSQVCVKIVQNGPDEVGLDSSFKNRY